jgi:sugar lactone lactonase YvrE
MAPIYVDGKGAGIRQPEGVACRGNALVVADTGNGRLLRYTIAGENWTPGGEVVLSQLPSPIRVDVNSKGEILALDGSSRKIARIASSGEFLGYVAPAGEVQGAIVPRSIRLDGQDNLYLLDVFSARVLVLDPSGKVQREIPFPKGYGFLSDLAVDAGGNVYLLDSVRKRVYKVAKNSSEAIPLTGSLQEEAYFPTSIATDKQGTIFLVDQNGSGVVILGPDGSFRGRRLSMGWKEGFLRYPAQMCITENGTAFIADRGNNRVDGFLITE